MKIFSTKKLNKLGRYFIDEKTRKQTSSLSESLSQSLFIGLSLFVVIIVMPLFLFGAYMYLKNEMPLFSIVEILSVIAMILVMLNKKLSIKARQMYIVMSLYAFSIVVLISTGNKGAGIISVIAIMFLAGIILDSRKLIYFLASNLIVFSIITALLYTGVFDGYPMETYKDIWMINALTAQLGGIGLMALIHLIYKALSKQNIALERSRKMLRRSEASKSVLLSNIRGMVYRCKYDKNWTMEYISEGCFELTGYPSSSLLNNNELAYNEIISEEYREDIWNEWEKAINNKDIYRGEYQIVTAQGEKKWVYEQGKGVYNSKGNIKTLEGIIIDITERKNKEDKIMYLNQYDVLTGLHNRRWLEEQKHLIDVEENLPISIIAGDINGLKLINDTLGHDYGDSLIKEVADILKTCSGEFDFSARTGGDEFIMILPNTDSVEAEKKVAQVQKYCKKKNSGSREQDYYFSVSLGYATKSDNRESIDEIIKIAENYMYNRKLLENKSVHNAIIKSIQATMYERSNETKEHSERLAFFANKIGKFLKLSNNHLDELELLAMLHDIGKIGVDDNVLKKPGKLNETEWIQMKRHPEIGYRIAISSPELSPIADFILSHHERWDGNGYPRGLKENDIPLPARIISVVDAFDAMTNDRPYSKSISGKEALDEIKKNSGTQFDPEIVDAFINVAEV